METRYFALILGIIYLAIGILGFIPALLSSPIGAPELALEGGYGYLLGLFPVNWLHNLVHIAFGIWGIVAYRSFGQARTFARTFAIVFAILAVLGLVPGLRTVFGLVPLHGHDIWLHAVSAAIAAYFGWKEPRVAETTAGTPRRSL